MNNFSYTRANDVAAAVRAIDMDSRAKFIAGGTNLIDLMKENVTRPSQLIDITHLPLKRIEETRRRRSPARRARHQCRHRLQRACRETLPTPRESNFGGRVTATAQYGN